MKNNLKSKKAAMPGLKKVYLFPVFVLCIYAVLYFISPDKTFLAMEKSGSIMITMAIPLSLVFVLMLILSIFLNPAKITKMLGRESGGRGMILSAIAGIISAGPIYAWYPLLKDLKERGAGESSIAIFLYNRSVKPFLLPVMMSYFGLIFVVVLTLLTVAASFAAGFLVNLFAGKE